MRLVFQAERNNLGFVRLGISAPLSGHENTKRIMRSKIYYPVKGRSKSILSQLFLIHDLLALCIYISLDMNFHIIKVYGVHCLISILHK